MTWYVKCPVCKGLVSAETLRCGRCIDALSEKKAGRKPRKLLTHQGDTSL